MIKIHDLINKDGIKHVVLKMEKKGTAWVIIKTMPLVEYIALTRIVQYRGEHISIAALLKREEEYFKDEGSVGSAKGVWVDNSCFDESHGHSYTCVACGHGVIGTPNYCPNCGDIKISVTKPKETVSVKIAPQCECGYILDKLQIVSNFGATHPVMFDPIKCPNCGGLIKEVTVTENVYGVGATWGKI